MYVILTAALIQLLLFRTPAIYWHLGTCGMFFSDSNWQVTVLGLIEAIIA